jgi:hypothetical protein
MIGFQLSMTRSTATIGLLEWTLRTSMRDIKEQPSTVNSGTKAEQRTNMSGC